MKKIHLFLLLLLCPAFMMAQVHTFIPNVQYTLSDDLEWYRRYESEIQGLRDRDKEVADFHCDALFVGSSSIRMWKTLKEDFPMLNVVNRGYGGATIRDILYNYSSVFSKYQPRNIVFYCDNDISGGNNKHDITAGEWYDLYRTFFQQVHADYPDAKIYALSIKYSGNRAKIRDTQRLVNALLKEYCDQQSWLTYVDVTSTLLLPDGTPDNSLFLQDQLHITRQGYTLWTNAILKAGLK